MYQMKHKNYDRFWVDKYIIPLANIVYSSLIFLMMVNIVL